MEESVLYTLKIVQFNSGTFIIKNSNIQFFSRAIFQNCRGLNATSISKFSERRGGALTSINSNIWFFGLIVLFHNNSSEDVGGAFCAMHASRIFVNKSIFVVKNHAKVSGGGIYLYVSNIIFVKDIVSDSDNRVCNRWERRRRFMPQLTQKSYLVMKV